MTLDTRPPKDEDVILPSNTENGLSDMLVALSETTAIIANTVENGGADRNEDQSKL